MNGGSKRGAGWSAVQRTRAAFRSDLRAASISAMRHPSTPARIGRGPPRARSGVVRDNLETFLGEVADHGDGAGLPRFAERWGFLLTPALSAS